MKFTDEHYELLKTAYDCLKKVTEDFPFVAEDIDTRKLYEAFMALAIILDN